MANTSKFYFRICHCEGTRKPKGLKLNGHISFWSMPMMLIYCAKTQIL